MQKVLTLCGIVCLFTQIGLAQLGRVGVNTGTPQAMFHVRDSSVLFTGPPAALGAPAAPPASGSGMRTMWYVDKGAFRTGRVTAAQWDKDNIGIYSFASGQNNIASGAQSVAMGNANSSTGINAFTFGANNKALGNYTLVGGLDNKANAHLLTVFGRYNDTLVAPGTFNSTSPLFIIGNGVTANSRSNALTILNNGDVGIGVAGLPRYRLHVVNYIANDGGYAEGVFIENTGTTGEAAVSFRNRTLPSNKQWMVGLDQSPWLAFGYHSTFQGATTRMVIDTMGRIGVGTIAPNNSAIIDMTSANKGVLVPRIALTASNVAAPVSAPADALLIYNTATAGSGVNEVEPGFYHWNATYSRWTPIRSALSENGSAGFGTWGDCEIQNVSEYLPVMASDGSYDVGISADKFGGDVAVDGQWAIISATGDNIGFDQDQGSAYMFTFNGSIWTETQKLVATDGAAEDAFGRSVAISGDYAIVGGGEGSEAGFAYIFHYNGATWTQQQKLTASDGVAGDRFGWSVSIEGNYAIIGAAIDDVGGNSNQGSAYVFFYNGSTWVEQQKLTASDGGANDNFGSSVSLSGNYALISATGDVIGGNNGQGSAYVFVYNGTTWTQQQKLTASDGAAYDYFGKATVIRPTECVISPSAVGNAVYYFTRSGTVWTERQKLEVPGSQFFGNDLSMNEDYLLVADYQADVDSIIEVGAVYIFQRLQNFWVGPLEVVTDPMGRLEFQRFGNAIAHTGDRFVIGAQEALEFRGKAIFGRID